MERRSVEASDYIKLGEKVDVNVLVKWNTNIETIFIYIYISSQILFNTFFDNILMSNHVGV